MAENNDKPHDDEVDPAEAKLNALIENVRKATKSAQVEAPDPLITPDLTTRLDLIESRAKASKQTFSKSVKNLDKGDVSSGTAVGFAVAYNLVGCVLGGWLLGWGVDKFMHGTYYGQVGGVLLGGIIGLSSAVMLILRKGG